MSATHGGKGSGRRPTDAKKFNDNWDRIFKKKESETKDSKDTSRTESRG
jgi:hypothetical protein